ncbi:MAG: hypothetical protein A3D94_08625 [Alphaproteobacteria bacterium RIFCSPHIGHO2_12_FULL_66_14]|jgi:hypothetical protein|nr:MAG: hypothetical protein A3D94_08625 [Alphaproteobacteria bacterium RIFCSPHIGHO2_12_FULL_66_14]
MPIHWNIDPAERLLTAEAEGEVTRSDADRFLDAMAGAVEAMGYRKLFDATRGHTSMSTADMLALGVRMRGFHALGPMGPLAVVVPPDKGELVSRVLGMLAAAERPMRVFGGVAPARRWIEAQAK